MSQSETSTNAAFVWGPSLQEYLRMLHLCCYANRLLDEIHNGKTTADTIRGLTQAIWEVSKNIDEDDTHRSISLQDHKNPEATVLERRLYEVECMLELDRKRWEVQVLRTHGMPT